MAATDDSSLQTIYAHATYHADDILWNHRFAQSCVEMDHLQVLHLDCKCAWRLGFQGFRVSGF